MLTKSRAPRRLQLHEGGPAVIAGVGTLHDATGGRPELSRKFHEEMQPFGCDQELLVALRTRDAEAWGLADLGGTIETPPASVLTVAGHVLGGSGGPAESRVRADGGRWIVLYGSRLDRRDGRRQVSVVIEAAQPVHLTSLLMRAYGLTSREQEVARLVLRGESTETIARELVIASGTVQAHLRNIFEKTGVRSRRELVAVAFQRHYEPRVRDNEQRTTAGLPSRHGPMPD